MERFYSSSYSSQQGESAFYTSPSTPSRNSDVDFNDVFGGPPRRSSINSEIRHSLSYSRLQDLSQEGEGEEGEVPSSCAWRPERERPVFGGEDFVNRRRYSNKNSDFYDDIFRGDESPIRNRDQSQSPFPSRVLSPSLADPLSSSLPSNFSLPAKLSKGMDLPTFGYSTRRRNPLNNFNDGFGASDGVGSSDSHLSRFSTPPTKHKEDPKNASKPAYRQSLLSKEFSDIESNMKQDQSNSNGQFHFSIYKWASKGVPMVMPLRTERKDKLKFERSSSAKECVASEITTQNDSPASYKASLLSRSTRQDGSNSRTTIQNGADSIRITEQRASSKAQSETMSSSQTVTKDDPGSPISSSHSASEKTFSGKKEAASGNQKLETKTLRSLLNESNAIAKQDYNEITRRERQDESKMKITKELSNFDNVNPNKREETTVSVKAVEHSKAASPGSLNFGENMGKDRIKGKVKEFVRIFNQEAATKPRVEPKSEGSLYKQRDALRTKNGADEYSEQSKKESSRVESSNGSSNNLSQQDDISASATPDISFTVIGDKDGSFHGNFTIQVLAEDENDDLKSQDNKAIQVIDKKIQQWSKGKEANIRSLLSTLQLVLWPECGWKPVPLVDIIEGNAVRRAYQRALLCLHPDKLQQKGAASHQKYIAEKVFDILQEAWTQFNMLGAL
ncbi:J domain-containing protein required for chloroplast accumulation response 1 isoform X2 [Arachis stenosperma]|uniref:J domain-containing protein required for chloroplast accumulation response 1 isoform X2 n=1 Tax=Arachis stenosperma TaxID=217475 RepID=UPI0025AC65C8|nr:J domain-containing protein required for chloroplast accumulation response 1 isoform X2 [Arachis stenosperma]